jgi:hypothetical protein
VKRALSIILKARPEFVQHRIDLYYSLYAYVSFLIILTLRTADRESSSSGRPFTGRGKLLAALFLRPLWSVSDVDTE